jgi:hypothetical protein
MIQIIAIICLAKSAFAAFDYRESPPAALFPFFQAASDSSIPDSISNPAYLPRIRYPYLHFSGSMPYTLDGLYSSTLRIGYGTKGFGIQATWNRFGFDQYLENVVGANIAYMPVKYVSIGAGASYYNLLMDTAEVSMTTHLADGRISVLVAPFDWIELAFQQENIVSLFIRKRRDILFPEWSAGAALKPLKGLALIYNLNKTSNGYVNCVSASANILKYFSLKVGYAREATTYSAALSFMYKYISVSYGLKYHPHLGFTHSAGVTLSMEDMNIDSLTYGSILSRIQEIQNIQKTDINSCSMDQLKSVPVLGQQIADRIMKYRKAIGPLSRKSLIQIGLLESEIDRLMPYISGLAPDEAEPKIDYRSRERYEKAQKEIFKKFVGLGLPAASALDLADMAIKGQRQACLDRITSQPDLDAQKKKKALELCAGPQ